jgi:outer membrane murein-binding lipoprotein Lpp
MARLIPMAVAGALVVACGRSPAKQAEQAATELRSWNATVELLNQERARGSVPDQFAEQLSRAVERGRAKAEVKLRQARAR